MTTIQSKRPAAGPGGDTVRVLIVDDSSVVRGLLTRWISEDPGIEVVGSVGNGEQAVKTVASSHADVVILDIEMPIMDGITALPKIIAAAPHVKVVMSSTLTRRNAEISLRALSLGAADTIAKPESVRGVTTSDDFRHELIGKVKALGAAARRGRGAPIAGQVRAPLLPAAARTAGKAEPVIKLRAPGVTVPRILAIGSSTGGPQALFEVFGKLGRHITVPVVITQHMPATFTAILAEHLAKASGLPAKEGEDGDLIRPGHIYVAPGGRHMVLTRKGDGAAIRIHDEPPENFCRPAVDPLFRSVASVYGPSVLAVVLTGMGHDGREGARPIVEGGGTVLAQDAATSVVWGMPGAVAEAGLCAAVLPLGQLPDRIIALLRGTRK